MNGLSNSSHETSHALEKIAKSYQNVALHIYRPYYIPGLIQRRIMYHNINHIYVFN